ncbi:MAG: site-2 protease family protein, partial [Chloroflexi bacterium]|nr:site-2 protease family protein [Chloroflexota bacterium]
MLLRSLDLLFSDPAAFLLLLPVLLVTVGLALVVGITVHEYSHALAAYRLGDATAKMQGRLSLNPLAHLDPMGTAMIFLVGFGWGKPVPVNPHMLRKGGRTGMSLVAAAGPLANLVTAALLSIPMRMRWVPGLSFFSPLSFHGSATEMLGS